MATGWRRVALPLLGFLIGLCLTMDLKLTPSTSTTNSGVEIVANQAGPRESSHHQDQLVLTSPPEVDSMQSPLEVVKERPKDLDPLRLTPSPPFRRIGGLAGQQTVADQHAASISEAPRAQDEDVPTSPGEEQKRSDIVAHSPPLPVSEAAEEVIRAPAPLSSPPPPAVEDIAPVAMAPGEDESEEMEVQNEEEEEEEEVESMARLTHMSFSFEAKIMRPIIITQPSPPQDASDRAGEPPQPSEEVEMVGESRDQGVISEEDEDAPVELEVRRGPALSSNGLSASDVAIAVLHNIEHQNSREIYATLRKNWIRHFPNTLMYVKHRKGSYKGDYLKILTQLKKNFSPRKIKWYVFAANMLTFLASYDPKTNNGLIIGSTHCKGQNFKCKSGAIFDSGGGKGEWLGWTTGGAGIVLSSKAATKLQIKSCLKHYTNTNKWNYTMPAADVIMSCCSKDSGLEKVHNAGFVNGLPGHHECQCQSKGRPLCTLSGNSLRGASDALFRRRLTYHHVSTPLMNRLFRLEMTVLGDKKYNKKIGVFDLDDAKVIHVRKAKSSSSSA